MLLESCSVLKNSEHKISDMTLQQRQLFWCTVTYDGDNRKNHLTVYTTGFCL